MLKTFYEPELKAKVIAELLTGASPTQLSKKYNIPIGTLTAWKNKQLRGETPIDIVEKKERIGKLLLLYLEKNLETLIAELEVFSEKTWIRKQNAHDMAILHGVLSDKSARMVKAFRDSQEE